MANKIRQAYEQGLRIYNIHWSNDGDWIKKFSETESIDEDGKIYKNDNIDFYFDERPEDWEIYYEDLPLFTLHDTLPETLIINGIKYKRDDN